MRKQSNLKQISLFSISIVKDYFKINKKSMCKKILKLKLFLIPFLAYSQENIKFSETINVNDLQRHLNILDSHSLEGRETSKPGQKMASE